MILHECESKLTRVSPESSALFTGVRQELLNSTTIESFVEKVNREERDGGRGDRYMFGAARSW